MHVVVLVVGGGKNTIKVVEDAVRSKTPVVVRANFIFFLIPFYYVLHVQIAAYFFLSFISLEQRKQNLDMPGH